MSTASTLQQSPAMEASAERMSTKTNRTLQQLDGGSETPPKPGDFKSHINNLKEQELQKPATTAASVKPQKPASGTTPPDTENPTSGPESAVANTASPVEGQQQATGTELPPEWSNLPLSQAGELTRDSADNNDPGGAIPAQTAASVLTVPAAEALGRRASTSLSSPATAAAQPSPGSAQSIPDDPAGIRNGHWSEQLQARANEASKATGNTAGNTVLAGKPPGISEPGPDAANIDAIRKPDSAALLQATTAPLASEPAAGNLSSTSVAGLATTATASTTTGTATPTSLVRTDSPVLTSDPASGEAWSRHLEGSVKQMIQQGPRTMHLQMNPAELGRLQVNVNIQNDVASLTFNSQHGFVKEMIETTLPQLRQNLANDGVDLGRVEVSADDSNKQNADPYQNRDQDSSLDRQASNQHGSEHGDESEVNSEELNRALGHVRPDSHRGVDYFV